MPRPDVRTLLRNRELRQLYLATVVSDFGSQFGVVAIAFAALHVGGPALLGIVLAARTLPAGLLVLWGGYLADRLPRQRLMAVADAVRGGAQVATAVAVAIDGGTSSAVAVVAAQVAYGAAEAFFTPAARGIVPRLVDKADISAANALMGLTRYIVRPLGPAFGGVLVAFVGPVGGLLVDAASFVLGMLLVLRIRVPKAATGVTGSASIRDGFRQVLSYNWLLAMIAASIIFQAAVLGPVLIGGPTVTASIGGPTVWGLLLGAAGLGSVLGSLVALRIRPSRPLLAMSALILLIAPYPMMFALGSPVVVLLGAAVLYGMCLAMVSNIYFTVLHVRVPDEYLGRILAVDEVCSIAMLPLSQVVAGLLVQAYGGSVLFWGSTGAVVVASAVLLAVPEARRLTDRPEPEPESVPEAAGQPSHSPAR
ncbi:MFS transporter [Micromonospora sp. NPDC047074]|uniref:MFS transporter n=1 Tax=Micromonospora sp. NPDC047074 TaxID=3154339 RepID=UPI00340BF285